MLKPQIKTLIKVVLTILFIGILIQLIEIDQVISLFKGANLSWFSLAVGIIIFDQVFMGVKWNVLLRALNINVSVYIPVIAYLRGRAFKFIIPSTLGIDAYKAFYLKKYHNRTSDVVASIVVERFLGIISSVLIIAILLYFFIEPFNLPLDKQTWIFSIFCVLLALITLNWLVDHNNYLTDHRALKKLSPKIYKALHSALLTLDELKNKKNKLYLFLTLSVVEKIFFGAAIYCCARSLGVAEDSMTYIIAATPLLSLLERLPISISSIGLREGLFVGLFSPLGIDASQALSIALLLRATEITQVAVLIFIWYIDPSPPPGNDRDISTVSH